MINALRLVIALCIVFLFVRWCYVAVRRSTSFSAATDADLYSLAQRLGLVNPTPSKTIDEYVSFLTAVRDKKMRTTDYVHEVFEEYKKVRIEKTNLSTDGDMLLLQWYTQGDEVRINLSRQIVQDEGGTIEFDDCAVQVGITFCFKNSNDALQAGTMWIETPQVATKRFDEVLQSGKLDRFLTKVPDSVLADHFRCG